jgi:hypothetical protein
MRGYEPPNPFTFGNTARMSAELKKDKEEFKKKELEKDEKVVNENI